MLRHLLKVGDLTRRSERNAVLTRTLFEAFKDRHKEYILHHTLSFRRRHLLSHYDCLQVQRGDYQSCVVYDRFIHNM